MADARKGLKGVVGRLPPALFTQFKVFCLVRDLSVEQGVEMAVRRLLDDELIDLPPIGEETIRNGT